LEDAQIVDLYLLRNEAAISETSRKYGLRLRALSSDITGDRETAEECENDTYLQSWNSIPPHDPRGYLYPFLARIIRHLSIDRCRQRQRLKRRAHILQLSAELEQCIPAPDDLDCRVDDMVLKEILNRFLSGLSPRKRVIFLRRYWYLDSVARIAGELGLTESSVKMTLLRCRRQLRRQLEQEGIAL